jgi:hypothetical protein
VQLISIQFVLQRLTPITVCVFGHRVAVPLYTERRCSVDMTLIRVPEISLCFGSDTGFPVNVSGGIPQALETNSGTEGYLAVRQYRFLPHPFQFTIH